MYRWIAIFVAATLFGCGKGAPKKLNERCDRGECASRLICIFAEHGSAGIYGTCKIQCTRDSDCPTGCLCEDQSYGFAGVNVSACINVTSTNCSPYLVLTEPDES